jgi:hypothetical protein
MEQVDLGFIGGIEQTLPAGTDVRDNVTAFVNGMNLATLIVISDALLSETGREKAIAEYNGGTSAAEPEDFDIEDLPPSRQQQTLSPIRIPINTADAVRDVHEMQSTV